MAAVRPPPPTQHQPCLCPVTRVRTYGGGAKGIKDFFQFVLQFLHLQLMPIKLRRGFLKNELFRRDEADPPTLLPPLYYYPRATPALVHKKVNAGPDSSSKDQARCAVDGRRRRATVTLQRDAARSCASVLQQARLERGRAQCSRAGLRVTCPRARRRHHVLTVLARVCRRPLALVSWLCCSCS